MGSVKSITLKSGLEVVLLWHQGSLLMLVFVRKDGQILPKLIGSPEQIMREQFTKEQVKELDGLPLNLQLDEDVWFALKRFL